MFEFWLLHFESLFCLIDAELICNIVLVSGVQQCDFVTHIAMGEYRYIDRIQNILYSQLPVSFSKMHFLSLKKFIYLF